MIWRGDGVGDYWLNLLFDYIISSLLTHPASPTPGRFHRLIEPTDACSIPADDFANPRPGTPRSSSALNGGTLLGFMTLLPSE